MQWLQALGDLKEDIGDPRQSSALYLLNCRSSLLASMLLIEVISTNNYQQWSVLECLSKVKVRAGF